MGYISRRIPVWVYTIGSINHFFLSIKDVHNCNSGSIHKQNSFNRKSTLTMYYSYFCRPLWMTMPDPILYESTTIKKHCQPPIFRDYVPPPAKAWSFFAFLAQQLSFPIDFHLSVNGGPNLLKNQAISLDVIILLKSGGGFYNFDQPQANVWWDLQCSNVPT